MRRNELRVSQCTNIRLHCKALRLKPWLYVYPRREVCVFLLFMEVFSIDVSQAPKECKGAQCVRVYDPYVTSHPLDQTCETFQLCHHVI